MRDEDFDIDSFPELHPEGKCGLNYPRPKSLSRAKYFAQRILSVNPMYRENPDYVFMAQQACERYAIERQIQMAMLHGSIDSNEKGEPVLVPSDDAFTIFQKVPGTPAYWKHFRNELYAKMEALGPFHLFFTISCAEMRWACILLEVLKVKLNRTLKIMHLDHFVKQDENNIKNSDEKDNEQDKNKQVINKDNETEIPNNEKKKTDKLVNVAWNGEASTVLIYDKEITSRDMQSKPKKDQDQKWKVDRENRLRDQLEKIVMQRNLLLEQQEHLNEQYQKVLQRNLLLEQQKHLNEQYQKEMKENKQEKEIIKDKLDQNKEKLEKEKPLVLKDKKEQKEFIDFIIELEDEKNELKNSDVKHIATSYNIAERSKIMTLDAYLDRYLKLNSMSKTDFLKDHFILITQMFDKRARDFIDTVMKQKGIEDYCFRVEFQLRGLPHIHGVAWLKLLEKTKDLLDETGTFIIHGKNKDHLNQSVIDLIEDWISCSNSTEDKALDKIVNECQVHKHTKKSCLKRGDGCRFDFPRPPSDKTLISRPVNEVYPEIPPEEHPNKIDQAKKFMTAVKKALEELDDDCVEYDNDLDKFLKDKCESEVSKVDLKEYHKLLQISTTGGSKVILTRKVSERNVNNFNKVFQKHWNANTDIQLCLDSFAVVTYITDYLTKADHGLTKLLITALKEKRGADRFDMLNHLKKVYFTHSQTCVCEAAYRLIPGLDLKGSSVNCLFVTSGFPHKRKTYVRTIEKEDDKEYDPIEDGEINEQYLYPEDETQKSNENKGKKFKKVIPLEDKKLIEPESKHNTASPRIARYSNSVNSL